MTLLNIDKRAVREADGLALLVQTSALENPFGISTIYLHPEDCTADGPENQKNTRTKIERLVREFANRVHLKTTLQPVRSSLVHFCHAEDLAEFVLSESREHDFYNAASVPLYDGDNIYMADNIGEKDFKEAACNIILTPRETLTGASFVQGTLKLEDGVLGRIPGLNFAWRFFNLWHEIAHGTGAGEPQANMIAAVITRRAFMDTDILKRLQIMGLSMPYYGPSL